MGLVMKDIEFPGKTHDSTKSRVEALAWATNRRGRNAWEGKQVIAEITNYLNKQNVGVDRNDVRYAIRWIVQNGYGWEKRADDGQHTTIAFGFNSNVNLNVSKPLIAMKVLVEVPPPVSLEEKLDKVIFSGDVPLPGDLEVTPTIYKLETLAALFTEWAQRDPEQWADYADRVEEYLESVLAG